MVKPTMFEQSHPDFEIYIPPDILNNIMPAGWWVGVAGGIISL